MQVKAEYRELFKKLKENPDLFIKHVLGEEPWDKQIELMNSVRDNKKTTVRSANGVGKDWTAARVALWFLYTHYPSVVITTGPTARQVEQVLWGEIRTAFSKARIPLGGRCLNLKIDIQPNWYALGFSTDQEDAFQGFHEENILIIFTEAQGVSPIIYNAASGCLTSGNAKLLLIGNPMVPAGNFYKSFTDPTYNKIHISALDSPNYKSGKSTFPGVVTREWVEDRKIEWGEDNPMYQSRVLGEFPTESDDTLIPLKWIEDAKNRPIEVDSGRKVLGVDVARYGTCETVACEFDGYRATFPIIRKNRSLVDSSGDIMAHVNSTRVEEFRNKETEIFVDDIGLGGGVTDILEKQGFKVTGLASNARALDADKYQDRRAEMYWELREKFRMGTIQIPDDDKLAGQLAGQKYEYTPRGQIRLVSKEKMRKEGIESPDRADALAMAVWGHGHGAEKRISVNFSNLFAGGGAGGY